MVEEKRLAVFPPPSIFWGCLTCKCNKSAESGFAALKLPGKTANPETLVEHLIDHTASILDVEDAVGEHIVVHKLQIIVWPDFLQGLAQFLSALDSQVRTNLPNNCVH